MAVQQELRNNTIKWLAGAAGDLQKQIQVLEAENSTLRAEVRRLKSLIRSTPKPKVMTAKA